MQNISDTQHTLRLCKPAAMSLNYAREERLGIIVLIGVTWGLYLAMLAKQFNQTKQLEILWMPTDGSLAVVLGIGLFGILVSRALITHAQQWVLTAAELANDGVLVNGTVIDLRQADVHSKDGVFIVFRFDYQGDCWIGEQWTHQQTNDDVQIGEDIVVRMLPKNPRVCALLLTTPRKTTRKLQRLKVAAPHRLAKALRPTPFSQTAGTSPLARHS